MKICLDAGHFGKYNQSPANPKYYESEVMWKLHLLQKKYLEGYGFEVILTRDNQSIDKEVTQRGKKAAGCDLFISDHSNATGDSGVNETVDYPVAFVSVNGEGNAIGELLADCIARTMGTAQKGRISSRNGSRGDYYGVIRGAVSVGTIGIILEHSFHTNSKATAWLLDDANLDKLAQTEAAAIAGYFHMTAKPIDTVAGVSPWAAEAWSWAVKSGITDGARPKDNLTREEAVTMLYRAVES